MTAKRIGWAVVCMAGVWLGGCRSMAVDPYHLESARWLVLGPFSNPTDQGCPGFERHLLAESGGEAAVSPRAGEAAAGRKWVSIPATGGRLDFLAALGRATQSVAYAYLEVDVARSGPMALKLGSDDGVKVWLNGELVWANHAHRALRWDEDAVMVDMRRGKNRLLLKVDQGTGEWEAAVRFLPAEVEAEAWAAQDGAGLAVAPTQVGASFLVSTVPAFAVREPVAVTVRDTENRVLTTTGTVTGKITDLGLPSGTTGVYRLQAHAVGGRADIRDGEAVVLVGDRDAIARETAVLARALRAADALSSDTLAYLADLLEGKLHATLSDRGQVDRAVATVYDIRAALEGGRFGADTLRGLRQWAYRSVLDGSLQPYTVYLPAGYDPERRYPLVVGLHGYGDNDYRFAATIAQSEPTDFIIVAPFGRGDLGYRSMGERDVLDVLARVQSTYNVDPDRISLMGISMGGLGAWRVGQLYTDRFAAVAPFCGWTGTEYLGNLRNTPLLVVHGDADQSVPVSMDRSAAALLKERHADITYVELHGVGHGAWDAWTEEDPDALFDYLRDKKLDRWPTEIDFTVGNVGYGRHFWVRVDETLTWPEPGNVRAAIVGTRSLSVTTTGIRALELDLRHPGLAQRGPITVTVDGRALALPAGEQVVLARASDGRWEGVSALPPDRARHTDGGYLDLFSEPLTIVYGTALPDRAGVLREAAMALSDWAPTAAIPIGVKTGAFRVLADTQVTERDLQRGSLLLLGDAGENTWTGPVLDSLPVRWANGVLESAGQRTRGDALLAVYPSPYAPQHRAAVLTLPPGLRTGDRVLYYAMLRVRGYNVDQTATRVILHPDVMIFDSVGALNGGPVAWAAVWDRTWSTLREVK